MMKNNGPELRWIEFQKTSLQAEISEIKQGIPKGKTQKVKRKSNESWSLKGGPQS